MKQTRSSEFSTGQNSSPTEPASLQQTAARFNSLDPGKFKPNSVLQQIMPSGDGNSATDAQRITPNGMLANLKNGASASTAAQLQPQMGMNLNL